MPESESRPTVLLLASSAHSTRLVGKQLQAYFETQTAADAERAWELLQQSREIALVVSEQALVIDAFGLLERIRGAADHWLAATPVLLLVGENDPEDEREQAFQSGATDFINLPFSAVELKSRARLHANIYLQQSREASAELGAAAPAANLLQQLSQQNFFASRTRQEIAFSARHRTSFSLCKLKVDNLKKIVSDFDKATAAAALRAVAKVIQADLRREDSLCYAGGADFLVLYPATNGIGASTAFQRIFRKISDGKLNIGGHTVPVTVTGAVHSCVADRDTDVESLYLELDRGIATARSQGPNQWVGGSSGGADRALSLDRALRQLEGGYQAELAPRAGDLARQMLPLLRFADDQLGLELGATIGELEKRLQ